MNLNLATERYVGTLHDKVFSHILVRRTHPAHKPFRSGAWSRTMDKGRWLPGTLQAVLGLVSVTPQCLSRQEEILRSLFELGFQLGVRSLQLLYLCTQASLCLRHRRVRPGRTGGRRRSRRGRRHSAVVVRGVVVVVVVVVRAATVQTVASVAELPNRLRVPTSFSRGSNQASL